VIATRSGIVDRDFLAQHARSAIVEPECGIRPRSPPTSRRRAQFGVLQDGGHNVAPGNVRCIDCNSLSRCPRCRCGRPMRKTCCIQRRLGKVERRLADDFRNRLEPLRTQGCGINRNYPLRSRRARHRRPTNICRKATEMREVCARTGISSVPSPEPDNPVRGMHEVIGALILRFRGDAASMSSRLHHTRPVRIGEEA